MQRMPSYHSLCSEWQIPFNVKTTAAILLYSLSVHLERVSAL